FEGRTRTHLSALLFNITNLKFDDRTTTLNDHIMAFENKWNILRQSTASAIMGTDSLAAGIKAFVNTDAWKATMMLATLPKIATYQNIINNMTSGITDTTYATTIVRLRVPRICPSQSRKDKLLEAPSAFSTTNMFCGFCKKLGYPGISYNEVDCRAKK